MAALGSDYQSWGAVEGSGITEVEGQSAGATTYFRGGLGHITLGTGKLLAAANIADASEFSGVVTKKTVTTGADQPIPHVVRGVIWVGGCAGMALASIGKSVGALAASDNPADILVQATPNPGAMGRCIGVIVTGASGYIDLDQKAATVNA